MSGGNQANQLGMLNEIAGQNMNTKIDTKKEFKDFENVVKDEGGRKEFINAVNSDQQKVLEMFSKEDLEEKIKESEGMSPEVSNSYKLLLSLKEKGIETFKTEVASDNFNLGEYEVALSDNIKDSAAENISQLDASAIVLLRFGAGTDGTPVGPSEENLTPEKYENKLNQVKNVINNSSLKNKAKLITELDNIKADLVDSNSFTNPYLHGMRCLDAIEETVKGAGNFAGTLKIKYDPKLDIAGNTQYEESERVSRAYLQIAKVKSDRPGAESPIPTQSDGDDLLENVEDPEDPEALKTIKFKLIHLIDIDIKGPVKPAKRLIEYIFKGCRSIRELIIKIGWTRSKEDFMNITTIGEFFKGIPDPIRFLGETSKSVRRVGPKDIFDLTMELGYQTSEILKILVEINLITWNLVIDRCIDLNQDLFAVTKMVCERGLEQLGSFLIFVKESRKYKENFNNVLKSVWEWSGNQRTKFVEICGLARELVIEFGIDLVNTGVMEWNEMVEGVKGDINKVKVICKKLIEINVIQFNVFLDWCNDNWTTAQDWFSETCKYLIEEGTITFDKFGNWCKENWTSVQNWFGEVCTYLLETSTIKIKDFIERCKEAGETVRQVACNILLKFVAIEQYTAEQFVKTLEYIGMAPLLIVKFLIDAGKAVYEGIENGSQKMVGLISEVVKSLIEAGKLAFNEFADLCNTNWENAKEWFKNVCITLIEAGTMKFNEFADWCNTNREHAKDWFENACITLIEAGKLAFNEFADWCNANREHAKDWFENACITLIQASQLAIQDFMDRCKKSWNTVQEIACNVLVRAINAEMVALNVAFDLLVAIVTLPMEAMKLLIDAGKAVYKGIENGSEKLVSFISDMVKSLIEAGKLAFNEFADWCNTNWENAKEWFKNVCITLIEAGTMKFNEFADWCNTNREHAKDWFENACITLIEAGTMKFNEFADWCNTNREKAKDWFENACTTLIQAGKLALEDFAERCKNIGEKIRQIACNVLARSIKNGKILLDGAVKLLVEVMVVPAMMAINLLIEAGKKIYEGGEILADFIKNLAVEGWNWIKNGTMKFVDYMTGFMDTVKELALDLGKSIQGFLQNLREGFKELGVLAVDFIKATYSWAKWKLGEAREATSKIYEKIFKDTKLVLKTLYGLAQSARTGFIEYSLSAIGTVAEGIEWLETQIKIGIDTIGQRLLEVGKEVVGFVNYVKEKGMIQYEKIKARSNGVQESFDLFISTAIEKCGAAWAEVQEWLGKEKERAKDILIKIFTATKEGTIKMMKFIGGAILKEGKLIIDTAKFVGQEILNAGKVLLELGIVGVDLTILALKDLGQGLAEVTNLCIQYVGDKIEGFCNMLNDAFNDVVAVGKAVASAIKNQGELIRNRIYEKTKDAKQALEAMKGYIEEGAKDVANWLCVKGLKLKEICTIMYEAFIDNLGDAIEGLIGLVSAGLISAGDLLKEAGSRIKKNATVEQRKKLTQLLVV